LWGGERGKKKRGGEVCVGAMWTGQAMNIVATWELRKLSFGAPDLREGEKDNAEKGSAYDSRGPQVIQGGRESKE